MCVCLEYIGAFTAPGRHELKDGATRQHRVTHRTIRSAHRLNSRLLPLPGSGACGTSSALPLQLPLVVGSSSSSSSSCSSPSSLGRRLRPQRQEQHY